MKDSEYYMQQISKSEQRTELLKSLLEKQLILENLDNDDPLPAAPAFDHPAPKRPVGRPRKDAPAVSAGTYSGQRVGIAVKMYLMSKGHPASVQELLRGLAEGGCERIIGAKIAGSIRKAASEYKDHIRLMPDGMVYLLEWLSPEQKALWNREEAKRVERVKRLAANKAARKKR